MTIGKEESMGGLRNTTLVNIVCILFEFIDAPSTICNDDAQKRDIRVYCAKFVIFTSYHFVYYAMSIGSYNSSYGAHSATGTSYERRNESRTWAEWLGLSPSK